MGGPRLVRQLWKGLWNRQSLGRIVITFYPQGGEASITVSPILAALSRRYWHWLYLQHLAESLAAIGETQERLRLLVAARAMAEDFVSRSYWPHVIGESISDAGAGAAEIVPERAGGVALATQVVQRGDGMPAMRLAWSTPEARERIASSNLVLLVHVMRGATHPLEHYEIFKKVALFVEHCERAGCPRERATLKAGALHAVVHADLTEMASPGGLVRHKVAAPGAVNDAERQSDLPAGPAPSRDRPVVPPRRDHRASPDPIWKRSGAAIGAAAVLWAGLVLGAFFLPRGGSPVLGPRPVASVPAAGHRQDAPPLPRGEELRQQPPIALTRPEVPRSAPAVKGRPGAAAARQRPRPSPETEGNAPPKFRVVSGTLALGVAEHRSKVLAEQGVDSFVREKAGRLGRLQYGAYYFREIAEEDARHLRAQGYTAVVIPW
jgi:hypothetical protein